MRDIRSVSKHKKAFWLFLLHGVVGWGWDCCFANLLRENLWLVSNLGWGGGHNLWTTLIVTFSVIINLAHRSLLSQKSCSRRTCLSNDLKVYQNYYYCWDDDDGCDDASDDDDDDGQGKGYRPQALMATNQLSSAKVAFLLEPPTALDRTWAHHCFNCHRNIYKLYLYYF